MAGWLGLYWPGVYGGVIRAIICLGVWGRAGIPGVVWLAGGDGGGRARVLGSIDYRGQAMGMDGAAMKKFDLSTLKKTAKELNDLCGAAGGLVLAKTPQHRRR